MDPITEPHREDDDQPEEIPKQTTSVGRGRNPASLANLKPRGKKDPAAPKVKYTKVQPIETEIYDFGTEEIPKKKKKRTKVVVVEQDSSEDDSEGDIQVVVAKKQKKKPPVKPAEPPSDDDGELEMKPPPSPPKKPSISFY
jgi:hypothetical protein